MNCSLELAEVALETSSSEAVRYSGRPDAARRLLTSVEKPLAERAVDDSAETVSRFAESIACNQVVMQRTRHLAPSEPRRNLPIDAAAYDNQDVAGITSTRDMLSG